MVATGFLFMLTAAQNLILAFHPSNGAPHAGRRRLGIRVRPGIGGLGHDASAGYPAGEASTLVVVRLRAVREVGVAGGTDALPVPAQ